MVISFKLVHSENALLPMEVTRCFFSFSGMTISFLRPEQLVISASPLSNRIKVKSPLVYVFGSLSDAKANE